MREEAAQSLRTPPQKVWALARAFVAAPSEALVAFMERAPDSKQVAQSKCTPHAQQKKWLCSGYMIGHAVDPPQSTTVQA